MELREEISAIIQKYLTGAKKTGSNNVSAICPFHRKMDGSMERNPSFSISLVNGLWHCFSCHESGNLRTFLRAVGASHFQIETQYGTIIREANRAAPVRIDPLRPGILSEDPLPESLLGVFDFCPIDLLNEGFTEETLAHFDVGFDQHHMRITYPLRDLGGNLVGISGRTVTDEDPRYKVYDREYLVWGLPARYDGVTRKRIVLWNADRLYEETRASNEGIVLVESFKACMWLFQCGIKNVVALLGSYLSEEQQWILERMSDKVYLMTDNDEAGTKAKKFVGRALSKVISDLRVVVFGNDEEKSQPDRLTVDEVHESIQRADSYRLWITNQEKSNELWKKPAAFGRDRNLPPGS